MAQTKSYIQSLLTSAGTAPRHRFGQNFMIDQNLVRLIAASAQVATGEVLIEVGPGTGTLTEELLATAAERVVAVEIDRDLAGMLREKYADERRFELIEADALAGKHELNTDLSAAIVRAHAAGAGVKLVANLPYQIASPLVIDLLLVGVKMLVFTVQKEVADRLRAGAGDDAYGPLSVMAQRLSRVEVLRTLPPQAFWPAPKIESALVRMTLDDQLGGQAPGFNRFVHLLFSTRRKTLRKSMSMAGLDAKVLETVELDGQQRPEELSPLKWDELFRAVNA